MARKLFEKSTIDKALTGIPGLDEITFGGLPAGRPTLVSGGPGSGKTLLGGRFLVNGVQRFAATGRPTLVSGGPGSGKALLGVSFLVNGAQSFAEPGVLLTFEENAEELARDGRSLGHALDRPIEQRTLLV